ncbi:MULTISPECIES: hypothetical protein [Rhizobium]|uniref:immunity protein Imm33 domain-containing protein n=1 Tax=Rhizobium TaxID=379 RepID=UPI001B32F552|nr:MULTISPECIES: hypothetical protein [Rhizobium]MBX4907030.1 hypothetical protein [Rhizobium bangladeshense]MBX5234004.1 hypothetical protein [Rhizobium sp. NLR4a]MBX5240017.1 hypothetical protein [Rhizobium sp. NLR22b]MBX5253413.1 hypothetical protein [Rhizobium sp. NLR4b]MBX5256143.1 hypothetical protein [Rhizobium sp. NLR16b]
MDLNKSLAIAQKEICDRYGSPLVAPLPHQIVGIARNVKSGFRPINGLRHPVVGNTTGWYIWAGEYSFADDFFSPLHISHLADWAPIVEQYLGLAPGWRFLIDGDYEDVWFDEALLSES